MTGVDVIIILFALIMAGNLDRLRGDSFDLMDSSKSVEAVLYGVAVAICFQSAIWWTYPLFAVLWLAGASFGWGEPMGAVYKSRPMLPGKLEQWQFWIFKRNAWAALFLRGFIWGFFPALLAFADIRYLACLAMTVILPSAVYLSTLDGPFRGWPGQEYYRGWLIAVVAVAAGVSA